MTKDEKISDILEIIKDESEKAGVRKFTCINGFGFSQFERNIAKRVVELLEPRATFSIDEIREYILKQDSMGDILYNLSEENILKANEPVIEEDEEEISRGEFGLCSFLVSDTDAKEELSECCAAPIKRGLCTECDEHV